MSEGHCGTDGFIELLRNTEDPGDDGMEAVAGAISTRPHSAAVAGVASRLRDAGAALGSAPLSEREEGWANIRRAALVISDPANDWAVEAFHDSVTRAHEALSHSVEPISTGGMEYSVSEEYSALKAWERLEAAASAVAECLGLWPVCEGLAELVGNLEEARSAALGAVSMPELKARRRGK